MEDDYHWSLRYILKIWVSCFYLDYAVSKGYSEAFKHRTWKSKKYSRGIRAMVHFTFFCVTKACKMFAFQLDDGRDAEETESRDLPLNSAWSMFASFWNDINIICIVIVNWTAIGGVQLEVNERGNFRSPNPPTIDKEYRTFLNITKFVIWDRYRDIIGGLPMVQRSGTFSRVGVPGML